MFNLNCYVVDMEFQIDFFGHKNIRSTHKNTIEITKDKDLTVKGDCIIGVNANYGCADFPTMLKNKLRNSHSIVKIDIIVNDLLFYVKGNGNSNLSFTNTKDIVLRQSSYMCSRTLAINCNKSAYSIPRNMIRSLQNSNTKGKMIIYVE